MIDPRISLMSQAPNLQTSIKLFDDTLNNIQNRRMNEQNMTQAAELQPLKVQRQQQLVDAGQMNMDNARAQQYFKSVADVKPILDPLIAKGDIDGVMQFLDQRGAQLKAAGLPTETTDEAYMLASSGDLNSIKQGYDSAFQQVYGGQSQDVPAQLQVRERLLADLESPDENVRQSARVALNLDARPSSAAEIQIARDPTLTQQVAGSQSIIAERKTGAQEAAKLSAQLKLKPEVDSAVKSAVSLAQAESERAATNRSNQRALDVYNVGMQGLTTAMDNAWTGPIAGLMPALTSDARVADGAIAAMAPILKSMFRSAGEGTFTDKDQELLIAMIPTRRDDAAARAAKLKNIDAIVRTKLGATEPSTPAPSGGQPSGSDQTQKSVVSWNDLP